MDAVKNDTDIVERLQWHKPAMERLVVSLDTRYDTGSNTDGFSGSASPVG